jgi:adenosylhomocysteine nucleosidase
VGTNSSSSTDAVRTNTGKTGIVVALPEEWATLTRQKPLANSCLVLNDHLLLALAGAGAANAEQAAKLLIANGATALISWGCAGALADHLQAGDLVIPEQVRSEQQDYQLDRQWLQQVYALLSVHTKINKGSLLESRQIIAAGNSKQELHKKTGAIAVDMETAAICKTAQAANLPCLAIRAIVDPAGMNMPQAVVQALTPQGRINLSKLMIFLLSHPWEIPALIKLGQCFSAAAATLKMLAKQLDEIAAYRIATDSIPS